jgi:hypothetical protein
MTTIQTPLMAQSASHQRTFSKDDNHISYTDNSNGHTLAESTKQRSIDDLSLLQKHRVSLPKQGQSLNACPSQKTLGTIQQLPTTTKDNFSFELDHPSLARKFRFQTLAEAEQFRLNPQQFFLKKSTKPMALPMKLIRGHDPHDVKEAIAASNGAAFVIDGADDAAIGIKNLGLHELISAALQVGLFGMFSIAVHKGERGALDEYQELLESIEQNQIDTEATLEKINLILKKGDQTENLDLFKRTLANEAAAKECIIAGNASTSQKDSYLEHLAFKQDMLTKMLSCIKDDKPSALIDQAQKWHTQLDHHLNTLNNHFGSDISPEFKRLLGHLNPQSTNTQTLLLEITECIEQQNKRLIVQDLEVFASGATRSGLAHMFYGMIAYQTAAATTFFTGTSQTPIAELISSLGDGLNALGQSEMLVSAFIKAAFSLKEGYDINALIKDLKQQQHDFPNDSTALAIDRLIHFKDSEKTSKYIDSIGNGLLANGQGLMLLAGVFGVGGAPVSIAGVMLTITGVVISQANALHWGARSNVIDVPDTNLESIQDQDTLNDYKSLKEGFESRLNQFVSLSEFRAVPKLWLERCLLIMAKPTQSLDSIQSQADKHLHANTKDIRGIYRAAIDQLNDVNKKIFDESLRNFETLFKKSPVKAENYLWKQIQCFMASESDQTKPLEIAKIPTTNNIGTLLKESISIANHLHNTADTLHLGYQKERRIIKQYVTAKHLFTKAPGKALAKRHLQVIEIKTNKLDWAIPKILPEMSTFIPTSIKNAYQNSKNSLQKSLSKHSTIKSGFDQASNLKHNLASKIKSAQAFFTSLLPERAHTTKKQLLSLSPNFYNDLTIISEMNNHLSKNPGDTHFQEVLTKKIIDRKTELLDTLTKHPENASSIARQHIALNQIPTFYTLSDDGTQLVAKDNSANKLLKKVLNQGIESAKINGRGNDKLASFWGGERRNPVLQTAKNDLMNVLDSNIKRAALATETTMAAYGLLQPTIQQEIKTKTSLEYAAKANNIDCIDETITRIKKQLKTRPSESTDALNHTLNLWIYSHLIGNEAKKNITTVLVKEMANISPHLSNEHLITPPKNVKDSLLKLENQMLDLYRQAVSNPVGDLSPFLVQLFDGKTVAEETTLNADYIQHWLGIQSGRVESTECLISLKLLQEKGVKFISHKETSENAKALAFRVRKVQPIDV